MIFQSKVHAYSFGFSAKCGSTSICRWLLAAEYGLEFDGDVHVGAKSFAGSDQPGRFKLSVVRDPVERLMSVYHNKIANPENRYYYREGMSLDSFVDMVAVEVGSEWCDVHWVPQHRSVEASDVILPLWRLGEGLLWMEERFSLPPWSDRLGIRRPPRRDRVRSYPDPTRRQWELINEIYRRDMEIFEAASTRGGHLYPLSKP